MAQRQAPQNTTVYNPGQETNSSEARVAKTEPRPETKATTQRIAVQGKPSLFTFPEQSAPYTGDVSLKAGGEARADAEVSSPPTTNARGTRNALIEGHSTTGNTMHADHRNLETCPSGSAGEAAQIDKGSSKGNENGTRNQTIVPTVQTDDTQNTNQAITTRGSPIFCYSGSSDSGYDTGGPASAPRNATKHVSRN